MAAIDIPGVGESFLGGNPQVVKAKRVTVKGGSGGDVTVTTAGTYALFNVPANTLILDVFANVDVAWTALVTLDIGDGDNASGYLATAKIAPQSAVATGLVKRMTKATEEAYAGGKLYAAADTIDLVSAGATAAAGELEVVITYIENFAALD